MVIPGLLNQTNDNELKTAWKKEFAVLSQDFALILNDKAGSIKNSCPSVDWLPDTECLTNEFISKLAVRKYCPSINGNSRDCWFIHAPAIETHQMGGTADYVVWSPGYPAIVLNDGALVSFFGGKSDCSVVGGHFSNECLQIAVDVNGFKGPNIIGKDIFAIHVREDKLVPYGVNDGYQNDCNSNPPSGTGYGCAAQYLLQ
jgi:hypothetical protein